MKHTVNDGQFEIGFDIDYDAITQSEPKRDPGHRFEAQFKDNMDPRRTPDEFNLRRNHRIKALKECDTPHLLYLLQIACDLHRKWVIARNQYFASISRTDRFIDQVDAPQLITNLLKWYNADKEGHIIDGAALLGDDGRDVIHDVLVSVGMPCYLLSKS